MSCQFVSRSLWISLVRAAGLAGCDARPGDGSPAAAAPDGDAGSSPAEVELLNVSYDATRELWKELNAAFQQNIARPKGSR